jgi:hypothetical protein
MTEEPVVSTLWTAIAGGFVGGFLGVLGTMLSSYYGPRKLEEWREKRLEERTNGPRKRLLKKLLDDTRFADGRKIETLARVTGTTPEECRRLLVELNARGVLFADGSEGWVLISRKPLDEA